MLSARITEIYSDFNEQFSLFSSKAYDVLEPEDERFEIDYKQFKENIKDLDHRLAFTLSQAFEDCYNLDSVFKVSIKCNTITCLSILWLCVDVKHIFVAIHTIK